MAQISTVAPTNTNHHSQKPASPPKLEDQAAIAALYVTKSGNSSKGGHAVLDDSNKLSSAGAAASLKYARPQDLPSFPSSGLKKNDSAAGAAATLGWANQKTFEHWKPDPSASASAAAMLAKDYKMKPLWQPEQSTSGAKAAVLAQRDGGKVDIWKPEASSWGNSAASQAFKRYGAGDLSPPPSTGSTEIGRQGSLLAAAGAFSSSRRRADSTPVPPPPETYPDERNASGNALKAAMSVSRAKPRTGTAAEGGAIPFTNMPKEMFTSHPPVAPEVDEITRQNTLRASAVAMARGMYNQQQKQFDAEKANHASQGAKAAHRRPSTASSDDVSPMYFGNLQEAAQRLAQERLSKLHNDTAKNQEYRDYYGSQPVQSRLSIRGRARRRASSDGTLDEDKEQSNKIRAQMSIFSSNLSQIDEKKRARDREALIAAAQRNVTKSLHGMDEKVFADTGKVAPSLLNDWEVKAHAAAQAKSESRMENFGKVNIGGGKFMNQSEVNLIAAKNVQPVLDEINEKAAVERERQAALKAEQEEQQRQAVSKKQREKEEKEINKKLKQQDKDEEKARKIEEKAAKDEEKRAEKEKRKPAKSVAAVSVPVAAVSVPVASSIEPKAGEEDVTTKQSEEPPVAQSPLESPLEAVAPDPIRTSMEDQASTRMRENADAANLEEVTPMSPSSPKDDSKVKNWFKTKFSRRLSRAQKPTTLADKEGDGEQRKSFVGGASLKNAGANDSTPSLGPNSSSMREVALAGKGKETETEEPEIDEAETKGPEIEKTETKESEIERTETKEPEIEEPETKEPETKDPEIKEPEVKEPEVTKPEIKEPEIEEPDEDRVSRSKNRMSEVSALTSDDEFQEARDGFDETLAPPPTFPAEKTSSPVRDSKFKEVM